MVSHVELESQFTFLFTRDYTLRSKRFCAVQQKRTRVKDRVACVADAKRGGEGEKSTYPFRRLLSRLKTARKVAQVKERVSFHFSRGQNRKSPSQVFLCSETKRKRLLRRLTRLLRVHRTDVVSQRLVLQVVHTEQLVAETCRCDLSPSVSRPSKTFHKQSTSEHLGEIPQRVVISG